MPGQARAGVIDRLRLWAIDRLRRSRFLPTGMPDKRADGARLGRRLDAAVLVYFPTGRDTLYQIRPWLPALQALDAAHRVTIVFKDSRTAAVVRAESGLDCLTLARYGQLDEILTVSDVKLALYINHDPVNFECLRFTSLVHVYLGHGDSDKGVSASNQVKAYDYCFVAGQAALDRTRAGVMLYDAEERSVLIGQPTSDHPRPAPSPDPDGRSTVLYAPTWEASQPSVSYGSLATHGRAIAAAVRATHRLVYRPHPLNGVIDPAYAEADAYLREHADRVDLDVPLEQSFADADLLITDVSAITLAWLAWDKPLVVTRPGADYPPSRLMDALTLLDAEDDVAAVVRDHLESDPTAATRSELTAYYLGDATPGVATRRFVEACTEAIAVRDHAWAEARDRGATGP